MTVHSAKGLEFDTVLLTGMEEETFPYRGLESESNEEIEEERRLAYVAITRARRRLYISHAASRTIFGQTRYLAPSRFLAQLPEEAVERRGLPAWSLRVHAAAARARQAEVYDAEPEDTWDQRPAQPDIPPRESPRPARSALRPPPRAAEGRVVDYSAFGDLGLEAPAGRQGLLATAAGHGALKRGTRVYHRRFGSGVVEQCDGPDKVVARFKGFGPKKVLLEYLTLRD
jgi:DNA helicase-2/ATP-dependent DNA helicase PcrA